MTLKGHEKAFFYKPFGTGGERPSDIRIAYFPDGQQIMSVSNDRTARQWDLRKGKEVEEKRIIYESAIEAFAVSRDGRWAVIAPHPGYVNSPTKLKIHDVKKWTVKTFKTHTNLSIHSIDVSTSNKLLATGNGYGTTSIWDLESGELVAGPFQHVSSPGVLRFSGDSRKIAVKLMFGSCLEVWSIEAQKLDVRVGKHYNRGLSGGDAIFWTTNDKTIVTTFSFEDQPNHYANSLRIIYEFDASTLETVGAPFIGHASHISSLDLSSDNALLVSASYDLTIKLWAFESRQLLASFNTTHRIHTIIFSPSARRVAYTPLEGTDSRNILICDVPPSIFAKIRLTQAQGPLSALHAPLINDPLNSGAAARPAGAQHGPTVSFVTQPPRYSSTHQQQASLFRHSRKFFPFSFYRDPALRARTVEHRDLLDCPATSSRLRGHSHPAPSTTLSTPAEVLPASDGSASASTTITSRLRNLSKWWPRMVNDTGPPIVDVALAPGQLRYAAAGTSTAHVSYVRGEDLDSSTHLPNSGLHEASSGKHGNCRMCFCM